MPKKHRSKVGYEAKWSESKSTVFFYPLSMKDHFGNEFQVWAYWPELMLGMKESSIEGTLRGLANGLSLDLYPCTPEYVFSYSIEYRCVFTRFEQAYNRWYIKYASIVSSDERQSAKRRFDEHARQPIEFHSLCDSLSAITMDDESAIAFPKWQLSEKSRRYILTPKSTNEEKLISIKLSSYAPEPAHSLSDGVKNVYAYTPPQFSAFRQWVERVSFHTYKHLEGTILPFFMPLLSQKGGQALCILNRQTKTRDHEIFLSAIKKQLNAVHSGAGDHVKIDLSCNGWVVLALPGEYFNAYKTAYQEKTGLSCVRGEGECDPFQLDMHRRFFALFPGYQPPVHTISFDQLTSLIDVVSAASTYFNAEKPEIDLDRLVVGSLAILQELREDKAVERVSRHDFGERIGAIANDEDWFYSFVYLLRFTYVFFQKVYGSCSFYTFLSTVNVTLCQIFDNRRYATLFNDEGRVMLTRPNGCVEVCDLNDPSKITRKHVENFYQARLNKAKQVGGKITGDVTLMKMQIVALSMLWLQMAPRIEYQEVEDQKSRRLTEYLKAGLEVNRLLFTYKPSLFMDLLNRQTQLFVAQSQIQGAANGLYCHNNSEDVLCFKKGEVLTWYQGNIVDAETFRASDLFENEKTFCTALGEYSVGVASRLIRHEPKQCLGQSAYYANHSLEGLCELRTVYGRDGLEIGKVLKVKKPFKLQPGQVVELTFNYGQRAAQEIHGIPRDSLSHPVKMNWFHALNLSDGDIFVLPLGQTDKATWLTASRDKSLHYEKIEKQRKEEKQATRRASLAKRSAKTRGPSSSIMVKKAKADKGPMLFSSSNESDVSMNTLSKSAMP